MKHSPAAVHAFDSCSAAPILAMPTNRPSPDPCSVMPQGTVASTTGTTPLPRAGGAELTHTASSALALGHSTARGIQIQLRRMGTACGAQGLQGEKGLSDKIGYWNYTKPACWFPRLTPFKWAYFHQNAWGQTANTFLFYNKSYPADPLEHGQTNMSQAVHSPCWMWGVRLVEGAVCSAWVKHASLEGFAGSLCPGQMRMVMTPRVKAEP